MVKYIYFYKLVSEDRAKRLVTTMYVVLTVLKIFNVFWYFHKLPYLFIYKFLGN